MLQRARSRRRRRRRSRPWRDHVREVGLAGGPRGRRRPAAVRRARGEAGWPMSTLEDDVRRLAEDLRRDDGEQDADRAEDRHEDEGEGVRLQQPDQPAEALAEVRRLAGATLSQSPEFRRACSASSSSSRSSSVRGSGVLMPPPPAATRRSLDRSARLEQFLVRADADHLAVLEHDDAVGVGDGRDALGDDDLGHVGQLPPQRLPQPGVGRQVERRERVVEDEDVGLVHDRPRDREPLALAARDVRAALRDARVELALHLLDEVAALRDLERLPELVVGRLLAPEAQVRRDGAGEQERTLRHEADALPEVVEVGLAHVDAADLDRAAGHVEQARDERDERRLARAGRADDRDGLAASRPEGDAREHRRLGAGVGELDVVEARPCRARGTRATGFSARVSVDSLARAPRRCARPRRRRAGS